MEKEMSRKEFDFGGFYSKYGTFTILLAIFILSAIFCDNFFTKANLTNVLRQITVVTILALGATFVIILGHINVAYGSMIALIGCVSCGVMVQTQNLFLAIMAGILLGILIGAINGFVITYFGIPAFIMTLAVTTICRGAALLYTGGLPVTNLPKSFTFIGQGYLFDVIPVSVLILLVLFIFCWILLNKTTFGRYVYAVGGNINAAAASGVRVKDVVRKAFILDGILAAISGIVYMSRMNSGQPASGVGYEFDAITAVVVGGTSLAGGSGTIVGTIIGAIIVGIINNVQNLMNVHTYWQQIIKGLIILLAVVIDVTTKKASTQSK